MKINHYIYTLKIQKCQFCNWIVVFKSREDKLNEFVAIGYPEKLKLASKGHIDLSIRTTAGLIHTSGCPGLGKAFI